MSQPIVLPMGTVMTPPDSPKVSTSEPRTEESRAEQSKKTKPKKAAKVKAPRPVAPPPTKLFEQLGHDMVNKMVQDLQASHDSPTLFDRLKELGLISVQGSQTTTGTPPAQSSTSLPSHPPQTTTYQTIPLIQPLQQHKNTLPSPPRQIITSHRAHPKSNPKAKILHNPIFTLTDFAAIQALSTLTDHYGRVSHMGILDGSYSFFLSRSLTSALCFKVLHNICVIGGDPLCPPSLYADLLEEFKEYRKKKNWGIIFIGASDTFLAYAKQQKRWSTIQFGTERVLNPVTNPVLLESTKTSKRIVSQNRQLLNPDKGGLKIGVYNPSIRQDLVLQEKLVGIYESWRAERNEKRKGGPQAFITVFDPFAILELMTYIYALNRDGTPIGFAALRRIGANNGFHIDPCIALSDAPRGVTDLLLYSSLSLLHLSSCSYLTLGYEPLTESGEMHGLPKWLQRVVKKIHRGVYKGVKVGGKKDYHDKWCPDEEQTGGLHVVFPQGCPGVQDLMGVLHFVNISVRELVWAKMKETVKGKKRNGEGGEIERVEGAEEGGNEKGEGKAAAATLAAVEMKNVKGKEVAGMNLAGKTKEKKGKGKQKENASGGDTSQANTSRKIRERRTSLHCESSERH